MSSKYRFVPLAVMLVGSFVLLVCTILEINIREVMLVSALAIMVSGFVFIGKWRED